MAVMGMVVTMMMVMVVIVAMIVIMIVIMAVIMVVVVIVIVVVLVVVRMGVGHDPPRRVTDHSTSAGMPLTVPCARQRLLAGRGPAG